MLGSGSKVKEPFDGDNYYKLIITTKDNKTFEYIINIDFINNNIIYKRDGRLFKAVGEGAVKFLSLDKLAILHPNYKPTPIKIDVTGIDTFLQTSSYEWNYIKADGSLMVHRQVLDEQKNQTVLSLNREQSVKMLFSTAPDTLRVEVRSLGKPIHEFNLEGDTFIPIQRKGPLNYIITAEYKEGSNERFFGSAVYSFDIAIDIPPKVTIDETSVMQGGLFLIKIENVGENEKVLLEHTVKPFTPVHKFNDYYIAKIPLDYWVNPGSYPLRIYLESKGEKQLIFSETLIVNERDFRKQYLVIDRQIQQATRNEAASAELAEFFSPVRRKSIPEKLWEGYFIQPVEGRITTEYGAMRFINGVLSGSPHSGLDIGARLGTPIRASNSGVIVLSRSFIMLGETIIIDHGLGIFTVYYHMNERYVEDGQRVSKGEIIGTVGSTGFSTGPHLHWTASIYTTNIDPHILMEWSGIK
jgi:murein DD-endopeptidase MepM/ murein hydrolase activator NlpD